MRRELRRLVERLAALDDVHDLSLTTNGYLLAAPGRRPRRAPACGASTSRSTRSPRTASSRSRAATRCAGARGASPPPSAIPSCARSRSTWSRSAASPRTRCVRLRASSRAATRTRSASSSSCRSTPTAPGTATKVLPNAEVRRDHRAALPARVARPRALRHRAALALRRRQGAIGFISPVTEPFCGDCNRIRMTAEGQLRTCLFSMVETDLRAPLRAGRERRRARADHPRRRLAQGAQAPRQRPGLRAAAADDVPDRRMKPRSRRRSSSSSTGSRRWGASGGASPTPHGRVAAEPAAARSTCRRSTARRWTATRCAPPTPRPASPLRLAGGVAAGEVAAATLEPGTAVRISTGAAIPPGADAVLQSERARSGTAPSPRTARSRSATHVRRRGEDVRAGDVLAAAGRAADAPAAVGARRRPASARSTSRRRPRVSRARSPAPSCCRWARRPSRAASTSPTA